MRAMKLTFICLLVTVLAFDGLIAKSSILYFVPLPHVWTLLLLFAVVNIFCFFAARILSMAGGKALLTFGLSLFLSVSVFLLLELVFNKAFSLIDTKSIIVMLPVVLLVLSLVSLVLKTKGDEDWNMTYGRGVGIAGISTVLCVALLFVSAKFGFSRWLPSEVYHSVVFIGVLFAVTIPLIVEYALVISSWRRNADRITVLLLTALLLLDNLGLMLVFGA